MLKQSPTYLFVEGSNDIQVQEIRNKELENCYDSLIIAKAWLGKMLIYLGEDKLSFQDDVATEISDFPLSPEHWKEGEVKASYSEKLQWLIQEIENLIENSDDFCKEEPSIELEQGFAYKYLCEAIFWLEIELNK
jgi:hypothetical protein